jgi:hypothetical protein
MQARNTTEHTSPETIRKLLNSYLELIVPKVYSTNSSGGKRWVEMRAWIQKHALFSVIFSETSHHSSTAKSALNLLKVWIVLLLQTFLLALFYDLQVSRFDLLMSSDVHWLQ